ncbi:MAG: hypothetical protein ACFHU9_04970 [Fluviicola sp.]
MARYIHIFRTILDNEASISRLQEVMNGHPEISRWHIDFDDVDNVLKVESNSLSEESIISLAKKENIECEALED